MNDLSRHGEPTLESVAAEYPNWHLWRGVSGLLYARRLLSSPPIVVRGEDATDLRDEIRAAIHRRPLLSEAVAESVRGWQP
jgi:hypothetical protein